MNRLKFKIFQLSLHWVERSIPDSLIRVEVVNRRSVRRKSLKRRLWKVRKALDVGAIS